MARQEKSRGFPSCWMRAGGRVSAMSPEVELGARRLDASLRPPLRRRSRLLT